LNCLHSTHIINAVTVLHVLKDKTDKKNVIYVLTNKKLFQMKRKNQLATAKTLALLKKQ
jgi:hypothetical protein